MMRITALGLILTVPASLILTSCETTGQTTGLGAATGALVGAGIGYAIDDSAEGALIGGLAGAALGGTVGYIVGRQTENREQAYQHYERHFVETGEQEVLDIRQFRVEPQSVQAGDDVDLTIVHSYVGPEGYRGPTDVFVRMTDRYGNVIVDQEQTEQFEQGTYNSTITLEVPPNLPPGEYGVDVAMRSGQVRDNASGTIRVL